MVFMGSNSTCPDPSSFCLEGTSDCRIVAGKIVICDSGIRPRVQEGQVVKDAGAIVSQFNGAYVKVKPRMFNFTRANQKLYYKITFTMKSRHSVLEFGGLVWKDGVHMSLHYMRLVNHRLQSTFCDRSPCVLMAAASSSSCDSHWKYDVFMNFRGPEAAASSSSAISTKLWIRKQSTPSSKLKSFEKAMIFWSSWQLLATRGFRS